MRITGGSARGRKLATPKGDSQLIRPTSDRVREAIFNIIGHRIIGSKVIDFFSGTGALGIEALSRGAKFAVFVDESRESGRLIHTNLTTCFTTPSALFFQLSLPTRELQSRLANKFPSPPRFNFIFMDPPYKRNLILPMLQMVERTKILAPDGLVIVEEHRRVQLPECRHGLQLRDRRKYGETGIWIYGPSTDTVEKDDE